MSNQLIKPGYIAVDNTANGYVLVSNGTFAYWSSVVGYAGSQGTTGYTGSLGNVGYTGSFGSTGYTGSIGVGYTGSAGFANGQSLSVNNFVITGTFTANSVVGTAGQILTSNSSGGVYWSNSSYSVTSNVVTSNVITTNTLASDFINIGIGNLTVGNSTSNSVVSNSGLIVSTTAANTTYGIGITANNTLGTAGQLLASNGTGVYWSTVSGGGYTGSQGSIGYTGSAGSGGGGSTVTISDTPPSSPSVGNMWWNSTLATMFIYYYDGNSYQWVEAVSTVTGYTGSSATANAISQSFTGNGSNTIYTLNTSVLNQNNAIVTINGLVQAPVSHYTISSNTLTFTSAPTQYSSIEVRNFENGVGGGSGSTSSSFNKASGYTFGVLFGG